LADFLAESANIPADATLSPYWNIHVDCSSTEDGNSARLIIESPHGDRHQHALKFMLKAFDNKAEYEALTASAELSYTAGADSVRVFSDS